MTPYTSAEGRVGSGQTAFNGPQSVTPKKLRIESSYPLDQRSAELCARMARGG